MTLSLTLTRQGPNLQVGVRAVERDDPQHVLFSRTVTDGTGVDVERANGAPPAGPVTGVGLYAINNGGTATVEVSLDNLACSAEGRPMTLGIQRHTGRETSLHWSHIRVLLEADSVGGTWKPWAATVEEDAGAYSAIRDRESGRLQVLTYAALLWHLFRALIEGALDGLVHELGRTVVKRVLAAIDQTVEGFLSDALQISPEHVSVQSKAEEPG